MFLHRSPLTVNRITRTNLCQSQVQVQQQHFQFKISTLSSSSSSFLSLHSNRICQKRMHLSSSSSFSSSSSSITRSSSSTVLPPITTTLPPPSPTATIGIFGTIFFGSLCVGTFLLGTWQTKRYFEKTKLIEQRSIDLQSKPLTYEEYCHEMQQQQLHQDATTASTATTPASFRKIQLYGTFHHEYEILVGPRGPPPGSAYTNDGGMASSPQGYYIITPLEIAPEQDTKTKTDMTGSSTSRNHNQQKSQFVLINRGWVPRHMVVGPSNTTTTGRIPPNSRHPNNNNTATTKDMMTTWDRPMGMTHVTVVPTQGEGMPTHGCILSSSISFLCNLPSNTFVPFPFSKEPRFLVAQHNFTHQPAILYWYDINTMLEIAHPNYDDDNETDSNSQSPHKVILPYATKVANDYGDDDNNTVTSSPTTTITSKWPVSPTADKVGEFKVSPSIHVGYAITWYGLSMAGLYMTRILLFKR